MIKMEMKEIIDERIRNCDELGDNWDYGLEQCWQKSLSLLTTNINQTIDYFQKDCNDEEFYWLSEIFEDLIDKTQSKELIQVLRSRLASVNPESYNQQSFKSEHMRSIDYTYFVQRISMEIKYAEAMLDD